MDRPLARYQQALRENLILPDPAQRQAIEKLDALHARLLATPWHRPRRLRLPGLTRRVTPVQGLYLWGGVGRGKTMLMDMFFQSLPFKERRRSHFHRFMNDVHTALGEQREQRDPLSAIATEIAGTTRVICFDEFFVSDITDAMILGTLIKALFDHGVTLVTTSNCAPTELYRDGLQRARFMPAIELLETHTEVLNVDGGTDYRLRLLERASIYQVPPEAAAELRLEAWFHDIAGEGEHSAAPLSILGREIPVRCCADGVAWFEFSSLCEGPRSQNDYIELARLFHTVLISGIPRLDGTSDNAARRLMALVDEFYDRRVKLIVSADAPPGELYTGDRLGFEFRRTASRLEEMQSHEYLAAEHRP
ncbi:MAG: AFG1 family ATPase [Gammaproteobacteria bacterium]|nr:AFG1 family ATPase [Gammaproteobacteria bacterium]